MKLKQIWAEDASAKVVRPEMASADMDEACRRAYLMGFQEAKALSAERIRSAMDKFYDGHDFRLVNEMCEKLRHNILNLGEDEL